MASASPQHRLQIMGSLGRVPESTAPCMGSLQRAATTSASRWGDLITIGDDVEHVGQQLGELFGTAKHFAGWEAAAPTCRGVANGLVVASGRLPRQDRLELSRLASDGLKRLLLGMDDPVDRVICLELGADEALPTGTELHEVFARIRRLFRGDGPKYLEAAPDAWRASRSLRCLTTPAGIRIRLSAGEWACLAALAASPHDLVSVKTASDHIPGLSQCPNPETRLRMQVSRLRRRLVAHVDGDPIISVYGAGYALAFGVAFTD